MMLAGETNTSKRHEESAGIQSTSVPSGEAPHWKKYEAYHASVDPMQDDMATEIRLCSFARPHMRAFHCNWWAFFIAFFIWFSITPLLPDIQNDLQLTGKQVWTSSIAGVGGTIAVRFILGPLCDRYGPRVLFLLVLTAASIPTACTGFVNTATGLAVLRLFIGIAGGCFVMCQYWTSVMFSKEIVGTANAIVAGWGNLGAGVTQLIVGSILFPLFTLIFDGDSEKAWRTVCVVPAFVAFVTGIVVYRISDDCPKGNYTELKKYGGMSDVSLTTSFKEAVLNVNTWIAFIQYAACFGVELTMNNATAMYFKEEFDLTTSSAQAIASLFGWMNLFMRGLGGYYSDWANSRWKMPGRLWAQTSLLVGEGVCILLFYNMKNLAGAIIVLIAFSCFVQSAEGTSFGIVPYIDPRYTGSVTGIVGAGGNVGAVGFGLAFRQLESTEAFKIMGITVLASSILSLFMFFEGEDGVFLGRKKSRDAQALEEESPKPAESISLKPSP